MPKVLYIGGIADGHRVDMPQLLKEVVIREKDLQGAVVIKAPFRYVPVKLQAGQEKFFVYHLDSLNLDQVFHLLLANYQPSERSKHVPPLIV